MKKNIVLVFSLICLWGCNNASNVSNSFSYFNSSSDSFVSSVISSKNEESSFSSSSSNSFSSSVNKGEERLQAPLNKNNKIVLPSQKTVSFDFNNALPDYFRGIYGNNFAEEYYAKGSLKIDSDNSAKKGFQTAMFESEKKLEVRLKIGEMHAKQNSKFEKSQPVLTIYCCDENGGIVDTMYIENDKFSSNKGDYSIRFYVYPAVNVSYLEVRATQLPYINSRSYNFGFSGIDLISWPYDL